MDDGKGNKTYTQYYYDTAGRKLRQYTGLNAPLTINGLDSVISGGDNSYSVTKYSYDSNGNLESYTDPTGHKENYEYDYNNRIKTKTLRNGKVMSYDYNDSGALHTVTAGTVTHTFTYNMANWLKTAEDENGTTAYDYDDLGRLTSEARDTTYAKGYDYYSNSAVKTFTFSKNNSLLLKQGYTYYSDGKLHNANVYNLSNTDNIDYSLNYAYDSNGNLTDKTYTAGTNTIEQEFAYNLANVVKSAKQYTGTTLKWQEDYQYRLDGNMTDKRDYLNGTTTINKNTVYAYDALGRLENETYKEGTTAKWTNAYTFDDYNNRSTMLNTDLTNSTQKATYYTYNRANQLVREETTLNGTTDTDYTYRYDAGGNMLAKEKNLADGTLQSVMSNTFDKFNRVASTTVRNDSGNNVTTSFSYDSNDHRINKTTSGTTTNQIWNGDNIVCDDVAGTIQTYIQGLDTEGMLTANGFYANIYNGRGDVVETHQLGGSTIEDYQYDAFGNNKSSATYTISNPYRYSGEYTDSETGLQYLRARYYDPSIGRFTQEDTYWGIQNAPMTLNLYVYCMNSPIMFNDPSGHIAAQIISGLICGAISAVFDFIGQGLACFFQNNLNVNRFLNNFRPNLWSIGWSFVSGFVSGVFLMTKIKVLGQALIGGITTAITNVVIYRRFDIFNFISDFVVGAVLAGIGGNGVGAQFFKAGSFSKGWYTIGGKSYSSLPLTNASVLRAFAGALTRYVVSPLVSAIRSNA